jgi:hypothetical protein
LKRFTVDGQVDSSFGDGGSVLKTIGITTWQEASSQVADLRVQDDGKILVLASAQLDDVTRRFAILRYHGDPAGPAGDTDADGLPDAWEEQHFGTLAARTAQDDGDGDGYVELLELALGMDPKRPDAGGQPAVVNEGGYLTMTVTKQAGVAYEVQSAGALATGGAGAFSAATTVVLVDDASTLKVRDAVAMDVAEQRYLRLKVTAAP